MNNSVEMVGYIAMTLLVVSFIPRQLRVIRIINFLGCLFFVSYGILLGWKWPIIISNGLVAMIQLYHLLLKRPETIADKTA